MLSSLRIIEILKTWNLWGDVDLSLNSVPRSILPSVLRFIPDRQTLALIGIRRSGKSTLMFQMAHQLVQQGVPPQNLLYVNFEEPLFIQNLSLEFPDTILTAFREIVKPSGRIIILGDEIQNIPSWERWVRIRTDQGLKIILSGSSSKLLSSELGTLLTGRQISFSVYPFSFMEFVLAHGLQIENDLFLLLKQNDKISPLLLDYLQWGGFPEAVFIRDQYKKQVILKQYFEDILHKDVAFRHGLKDITMLKKLGVYSLTNIGQLISYNKLAGELSLPSPETIRHYFSFLSEAFLLYEVPRFSFKYKEQIKTQRKVYAADLGMRNAVAFRFSADIGRLAENFVFLELKQRGYEIYYFQNRQEVDFYARHEEKDPLLINVAWEIDNSATRKREIAGLQEAMSELKIRKAFLLTERMEESLKVPEGEIIIEPLWIWSLRGC